MSETARTTRVQVRRARSADLPAMETLLRELDEVQRGWRVFQPRPDALRGVVTRYRSLQSDEDSVHLVAEEDGQVVGMAMATVHRPSTFSDERSVEVSSFVVRAGRRGAGIGRSLLVEVAEFARERRVRYLDLRVFTENEQAVGFWRRMGFRPRMLQMVADTDALDPRTR